MKSYLNYSALIGPIVFLKSINSYVSLSRPRMVSMAMCEQQGLHQVDLLSPAKSKITNKEYMAQQRGQKKLDELNKQIVAAKMKPRTTVFQTQKQYLRDAISDAASQAESPEEFLDLLKAKYGIEVKERRGRFSYLHPDRNRYITGRALGSDYEKDYLERVLKDKAKKKEQPSKRNEELADIHNQARYADSRTKILLPFLLSLLYRWTRLNAVQCNRSIPGILLSSPSNKAPPFAA